MDILDTRSSEDIQLNEESRRFILETAKWANFLAIVGFVFLGFMAIGGVIGLLVSAFAAGISSIWFLLFYLAMMSVYFFPTFYMFNAARKLKNGINTMNDTEITDGFKNLKSLFKFIGIFTIVFLSLYILMILFGGNIMKGIAFNASQIR